MTGDSEYIKKSVDSDPVLLFGSRIIEGLGKILITAIGVNSYSGIIMTSLAATNAKSVNVIREDSRPNGIKCRKTSRWKILPL